MMDTHATAVPPPVALLQMVTGYWVSQTIYVAAKLGIADLLKDGPKNYEELAKATGTHKRSLYRLLRALASVGVFAEAEDGRFGLTPLGKCLQTEIPGSVRAIMINHGERLYRPWGDLLHSVRTGEPAVKHVFECLAQDPESAAIFSEAMAEITTQVSTAVVADYDFSRFSKIVDIGGGTGTLILSILKANPQMSGILFELPHVVEDARKHLDAAGLTERCAVLAGDFFEFVPSGGDAYILKNIIHDWDDEHALKILQNCHRAMGENGKLLLVEGVIPPGNEPSFSKLVDLNMLVMAGGCERTEAEYRALFAAAGFKLTNVVPLQSPFSFSVIEGVRADREPK
jgi:SAM-dependent methyltransferase